jgi:hypothetical protein
MKTNKLDNNIKQKLQNRTFEPSASAWERLSLQLDEQPKQKKKGWFFYIGAAASILLLVVVGFQFLSSDKVVNHKKEIIVNTSIDTINIDKKIEKFVKEIPDEKAIVKVNKVEEMQKVEKAIVKKISINKRKNVISTKEKIKIHKNNIILLQEDDTILAAKVETHQNNHPTKEKIIKREPLKQDPNSSIRINSDDLLFAVTHSSKEVEAYYAKHRINREDVLKTIQNQLKESNLKVNPTIILAEVERTIINDDFQKSFMKSLKRKVTDIATAIASRND